MLSIDFAGWAICRLATDPDPYDEPRGVSGYMRAHAGEPDLDRVIRFQDPPFRRSHVPPVGVAVLAVARDGAPAVNHPLIGAKVRLMGLPVFEGRNGVVAEDGFEPIAPFHLRLDRGGDWLSRATVPSDPASPYREFNATGVVGDPGTIERATGITSLPEVWRKRLRLLEEERESASEDSRPGIEERIEFLRANLDAGGGVAGFFGARMEWDYALRSEPDEGGDGLAALLGGFAPTAEPWRVRFWFGGWDADAQQFYVHGRLDMAAQGADRPMPFRRRPERMSDIARLRGS